MSELDDLLCYDWQDHRATFFRRVECLYRRARETPEVSAEIEARVLATARTVRPPLYHERLWPIAFLLGQGRSIIKAERDFDGYTTYLYRGMYYALPSGIEPSPEAIEGDEVLQLLASASVEALHLKIINARGPANDPFCQSPFTGPDIAWVPTEAIDEPVLIGSESGINIVLFGRRFWGVPQALGAIDWRDQQAREHPEIVSAATEKELRTLLAGEHQGLVSTATQQIRPPSEQTYGELLTTASEMIEFTSTRSPNPLIPRARIADHRYAKVTGEHKLISVIIPYFRKQDTVFRCLQALREQEWNSCRPGDVEIIIVDDGTIGENMAEKLPEEVHYVWQRKNGYGICRAKNTGAKLSRGRYLAFLDPDVIVGKRYADSIIRGFARHGERIVQAGYVWDYHFIGCPDPRTEFGVWENSDRPTARFYAAAGGNMAIARKLYDETPGFDEDLIYGGVEDLVFGYHISVLPGSAVVFSREMEAWHIPHPPGGAHANPQRTWSIVKQKWPEFYQDYVENGTR